MPDFTQFSALLLSARTSQSFKPGVHALIHQPQKAHNTLQRVTSHYSSTRKTCFAPLTPSTRKKRNQPQLTSMSHTLSKSRSTTSFSNFILLPGLGPASPCSPPATPGDSPSGTLLLVFRAAFSGWLRQNSPLLRCKNKTQKKTFG